MAKVTRTANPPAPSVSEQLLARYPDGLSSTDVETFDANTTAALLNAMIASQWRAEAEAARAKGRAILVGVVLASIADGVVMGVCTVLAFFNPIRDLVETLKP